MMYKTRQSNKNNQIKSTYCRNINAAATCSNLTAGPIQNETLTLLCLKNLNKNFSSICLQKGFDGLSFIT